MSGAFCALDSEDFWHFSRDLTLIHAWTRRSSPPRNDNGEGAVRLH